MTDELSNDDAGEPPLVAPLAVLQARARVHAALFGGTRGGVRLGRYLLLEELGAGAMGLVYSAYDPQLDRKLAIKVLRGAPGRRDRDSARRLVQEARALARLSHPHVVAIHDVGLVVPDDADGADETMFIAMEYVRGTTLRRWLAEGPRPWREVVAVLQQAGRGLAAAHEVGLVHRDFKPENVMIGDDGRTRVMDFGLALPSSSAPSIDEGLPSSTLPTDRDHTLTGAVVGTPAYMAPEQRGGVPVDARSDQFAFCVVAWEALVGRRPFPDDSPGAAPAALAPGDPQVPPWLLAALQRGLALDPARRFGNMHALLAALADDPSRRRRRRIALAASFATVGLVVAGFGWERWQREQSCHDAAEAVVEVWNERARADVAAAIDATGLPYAEDTQVRVVDGLDAYAHRWAESRESSCLARRVEGRVDEDMAVRTDACLDEGLDSLSSWVELVVTASSAELAELTEITAELPSIDACLDPSWVARRPMPSSDPWVRVRTRAWQRRLTRAGNAAGLRRYEDSLREAEAVEAEAEAAGSLRLQAQAALQVAESAHASGQLDRARSARERALAGAIEAGDDAIGVRALAATAVADATDGNLDRAQAWLAMARALLPRIEPQPGSLTVIVLNGEGVLAYRRGTYREAMERQQQAVTLAEHTLPRAHPWLTRALNNLAAAQQREGDGAGAIATLERVVELRTQVLGPEHPDVASALANLGSAHGSAGQLDRAELTLERAITLTERVYGPDCAQLGNLLISLGVTRIFRGSAKTAVPVLERAVRVIERAHGAEHPQLAHARASLGLARLEQGDAEGALEPLRDALAVQERLLGAEHHDVAVTLGTQAEALLALGHLDQAEAAQRRVLAIRQKVLPPDHADVANAHLDLGRVLLARGAFEEALQELGRALALHEGRDDRNAAVTQLAVARGLLETGRVDEAIDGYERALAAGDRIDRDDVRAWAWLGIATVRERRGRWDEALAGHERARHFAELAFGSDSPRAADAWVGLAVASHALGRLEQARSQAERALELLTVSAVAPWWVAEAELVLAEILAEDPAERARAQALAQRACAAPRAAAASRLHRCSVAPGRARPDVLSSQ